MATLANLLVKIGADTDALHSGLSSAQAKVAGFSSAAKTALTAIGFGGIATGAIHAAEKFTEASHTIRTATGATGERLQALEQNFRNLYTTVAFSSHTVSEALSKIAVETKLTGSALEDLTKQNLLFAKVTGQDVHAAIEGTQTIFKQWGIEAARQSETMDFLFRIMQETGISAQKLTSGIAASGPALRALGFSFKETAILVGQFEEKGLDAANVVGALTRGMANFAARGVKDPKAALLDLIEKMQNTATATGAVNIAAEAFGKRGAVLISDAARKGALDIAHLTEEVDKNTDSVAKAAADIVTWKTRLTILTHEIEAAVSAHRDLILTLAVLAPVLGGLGRTVGSLGLAALPGMISNITFAVRNGLVGALGGVETILLNIGRALPAVGAGIAAYLGLSKLNEIGERNLALPKLDAALKSHQAGPYATILEYVKNLGEKTEEAGQKAEVAQRAYLTFGEILNKIAREDHSRGFEKLARAVVDNYEAGQPYGKQLELHRAALDGAALAAYQYSLAIKAVTTEIQIMPAPDWTKAAKGTALETVLDPESSVTRRRQADAARQRALEVRDLWQQGKATQQDYERAQRAATEAEERATGVTHTHREAVTKFGRQVSTIMTDLSRQLADVIFGVRSIGDAFRDVAKAIVRAILEDIIVLAIGKLMNALAGVLSHLGKIGKAIGDIFGGVGQRGKGGQGGGGGIGGAIGSTLGGIFGGSGGSGGGGGGFGGGGGGFATAGAGIGLLVGGPVGALVGGAIGGLAEGITGLISGSHSNTLLGRIEESTRYAKGHLLTLVESANVYWPALVGIHERLMQIITYGLGVFNQPGDGGLRLAGAGAGGGGGIVFQNCTFNGTSQQAADSVMTEAVRKLRAGGVRI